MYLWWLHCQSVWSTVYLWWMEAHSSTQTEVGLQTTGVPWLPSGTCGTVQALDFNAAALGTDSRSLTLVPAPFPYP